MLRDTNNDNDIKKQIENHLYWDEQINESRMIVRVLDGEVRLTGTVASEKARASLEKTVADMPDVHHVQNQLTVWKGGDEKSHTDQELQAHIEKTLKLRQGFKIEDADIEIQVEHGRAKLTGVVNSPEKKQRLDDVTRNIVGVLDVENELRIDPTHTSLSGTFL